MVQLSAPLVRRDSEKSMMVVSTPSVSTLQMEFFDINLTKDSSLLLHALSQSLLLADFKEKAIFFSSFNNPYKKNSRNKKTRVSFMKHIFAERKNEGRKLGSEKTRIYAQKPRLKMPPKNSIPVDVASEPKGDLLGGGLLDEDVAPVEVAVLELCLLLGHGEGVRHLAPGGQRLTRVPEHELLQVGAAVVELQAHVELAIKQNLKKRHILRKLESLMADFCTVFWNPHQFMLILYAYPEPGYFQKANLNLGGNKGTVKA
jgi:hypothetical protein